MGQLCMYIMYHLLVGLDMCVLYRPTVGLDVWYYLFASWCTYETMPLVRTYMYNSGKCLWEGYYCVCKTMPLIRTYMYNLRENCLSEGCRCMTLGKGPLRGPLMYDFRKWAFKRATDVYERQCLWLGLTCITLGNRLWKGCRITIEKSPLRGLLMYVRNNAFW